MIIGQLSRLKGHRDPVKTRELRKHLLPARLVCRRWNSIATEHLYQTLELAHTGSVNGDESRWSNLHDAWDDVEPSETRLNTLKAVFEAIRERAVQSNAEVSTIRSLTIRNLQNMPHQEFVNSGLFKDVAKDIDHYHLLITEEYNEHGPDRDTFMEERLEFESHLQRQFLPHFAANLTALTLNFHECWGTMPGYFDGAGLEFPRLKTLNLGNFVISNNRHFDWVLSQKSLETLRLDSCHIISHIQVDTEETKEWRIHTEDWQRLPKGSYGISYDNAELYRFDGTWESTFDKIRNNLPCLMDFRFDGQFYGLHFLRPSRIDTVLHPSRYINFDAGTCPSPWLTSNSETGEMEFGDYECSVNRSEETKEGDTRAFRDLLSACHERHK
ncbi:hypothetical protein Landi51_06653 [Colletotrichum acutatum]